MEQLLSRPVQILAPEPGLLLFLSESNLSLQKTESASAAAEAAERFRTLAGELYRCFVRISWCTGISPEACSVCYERMKQKLKEDGGNAEPVCAGTEKQEETDGKVRCIQDYIALHYSEELSLEKLSRIAYVHPDYLSRIFKKETGMNLNRYIKLYRLEKACGLLCDTRMKITDVSAAVGYQNCAYFIRSFNEQYGMSPEKYRHQADRRSK